MRRSNKLRSKSALCAITIATSAANALTRPPSSVCPRTNSSMMPVGLFPDIFKARTQTIQCSPRPVNCNHSHLCHEYPLGVTSRSKRIKFTVLARCIAFDANADLQFASNVLISLD